MKKYFHLPFSVHRSPHFIRFPSIKGGKPGMENGQWLMHGEWKIDNCKLLWLSPKHWGKAYGNSQK